MNSMSDAPIHAPMAPDEIDMLQRVFDVILKERHLAKDSPEALDLARLVIRLHLDGVECEATLTEMIRATTTD
jgi:hypothetical protein